MKFLKKLYEKLAKYYPSEEYQKEYNDSLIWMQMQIYSQGYFFY